MGKLMDNLQMQLNTDYKTEAKDCIKIYNKLSEINKDGAVWSSQWNILTTIAGWTGDKYDKIMAIKPSNVGYVFIKGI